jgi:low affinity Fe/Cu permease
MNDVFRKFARKASELLGSPWAFVIALIVVGCWALLGPSAKYSQTWQLVINTSTTIVTFLMVFIIQNTQNHDARAVHLKLDELIQAVESARNDLIDVEDATDDEQSRRQQEYERLRELQPQRPA